MIIAALINYIKMFQSPQYLNNFIYLFICSGKVEIQKFMEQSNFNKYDQSTIRNKVVNEKAAYAKRQKDRLHELADN